MLRSSSVMFVVVYLRSLKMIRELMRDPSPALDAAHEPSTYVKPQALDLVELVQLYQQLDLSTPGATKPGDGTSMRYPTILLRSLMIDGQHLPSMTVMCHRLSSFTVIGDKTNLLINKVWLLARALCCRVAKCSWQSSCCQPKMCPRQTCGTPKPKDREGILTINQHQHVAQKPESSMTAHGSPTIDVPADPNRPAHGSLFCRQAFGSELTSRVSLKLYALAAGSFVVCSARLMANGDGQYWLVVVSYRIVIVMVEMIMNTRVYDVHLDVQ